MKNIENYNFQKINYLETAEGFITENDFKIVKEKPNYDVEFFKNDRDVLNKNLHVFLEKNNLNEMKPLPIILKNGTTLFISSGIQLLESSIHSEAELPDKSFFINQPVIRSQFVGSKEVECHTSFHNLTTLSINVDFQNHLSMLKKWIEFLVENGFEKDGFQFEVIQSSPKWGGRKFNNIVIGIYYGGLDVGDAVYIPSMPQNNRSDFSISDIGFGLERLLHNPGITNPTEKDCLKTLALLSIYNVQPSNNDHGYRFRSFSKRLVSVCELDYSKLKDILKNAPDFIEHWMQLGAETLTEKDKAIGSIIKECERNFNREVLNFLKQNYNYQNEVDINQTTISFINQLEKIGDKSSDFWNLVKNLLKIN